MPRPNRVTISERLYPFSHPLISQPVCIFQWSLGLKYNPFDAFQNRSGVEGAVGHGWVLDVDIVLADSNQQPDFKRLLLPPNERINFARQPDGTYRASGDPRFDGAVLRRWGTSDWELQFRDGTRWRFGMTDVIGRTASFLIEIVEPGGRVTRVDRRADRKITRIGDEHRHYDLIYGANNLVTEIRDPGGRQLSFTYTADRRIETLTDADGAVTRYDYVGDDEFPPNSVCEQGSDGLRIKRIHYPGMDHPTENHHGPSRRVLRQTAASGIETRIEYEVVGACVTHVDNPNERCTGPQCPRIDSWENYQAGWRIIGGQVAASTVVDSEGNRTTRRYDGKRMISDITRADGQTLSRQRDADGRITRQIDALGRETRYTYNAKGQRIRTVDPLGRITATDYHGTWGKPIQITRALEDGTEVTWQRQYDASHGKLTQATNPLGHTTRFDYTPSGQLEAVIDPLGHTTTLAYNDKGDLVTVTDALGHTTRFTPDDVGRTTGTTDPLGFDTSLQYTPVDQLDTHTDPLGGQTTQTFDEARRLTAVINARGHAIESYSYDDHGRLVTVSNPLGQTAHYQYDGQNRVTEHRDRLNRLTRYNHDARGRLTTMALPDGDTVRLTYDAVGRLQSIEDNASRIDYRYDAADRLIRERTTNIAGSHEIAYTWDHLDRLTQRTVNGTDPTTYSYDLAGRLTEIRYRNSTTTYQWDDASRLITKTLPNGIAQHYHWDAANRLTQIDYRDGNDTLIDTLTYTYDAKGQRIQKTGGPGGIPETPFEAEYDAADRMTQITLHPGTANEATYQLDYDAEGNLTRKQNIDDPTDTTLYSWDTRNRLTALSAPTVTASFKYDALNRRIERTVNGHTLRALYDGPQLIGEITSGVIDTTYLTGLQIDEMLARYTQAGQRTYLTDALGTVIAQTQDDQTPVNWYAYSPFGEVETLGDDEQNPVQYTGRENDHTGLYYYRARYYDPVLKRFIARDPIGLEGGVNTYAYVVGNPLNFSDPEGLRGARPNRWNQFQQSVGGRGLTRAQIRSLYRQIQLNKLGGPRNPELHEALENLPDPTADAFEEEISDLNCNSFGTCSVEILECRCPENRSSCPSGPQMTAPARNNPNCFCWTETIPVFL